MYLEILLSLLIRISILLIYEQFIMEKSQKIIKNFIVIQFFSKLPNPKII